MQQIKFYIYDAAIYFPTSIAVIVDCIDLISVILATAGPFSQCFIFMLQRKNVKTKEYLHDMNLHLGSMFLAKKI